MNTVYTTTAPSTSAAYIGILDIAGNGTFCLHKNLIQSEHYNDFVPVFRNIETKEHAPNSFDQLCINYVNEEFQQFFIQRSLKEEKQWYDKEKFEFPSIPFLDNCDIIGKCW